MRSDVFVFFVFFLIILSFIFFGFFADDRGGIGIGCIFFINGEEVLIGIVLDGLFQRFNFNGFLQLFLRP